MCVCLIIVLSSVYSYILLYFSLLSLPIFFLRFHCPSDPSLHLRRSHDSSRYHNSLISPGEKSFRTKRGNVAFDTYICMYASFISSINQPINQPANRIVKNPMEKFTLLRGDHNHNHNHTTPCHAFRPGTNPVPQVPENRTTPEKKDKNTKIVNRKNRYSDGDRIPSKIRIIVGIIPE